MIVPGSESRPHFAGQAFIREGSQSREASQQQFEALIAMRSSKAYEILKYKGKTVTLIQARDTEWGRSYTGHAIGSVEDCNTFYVLMRSGTAENLQAFPLSSIDLSYDPGQQQLKLISEE